MLIRLFLSILSAIICCFTPAYANEIRAGMWEHDAEIFGLGGNKGKETSLSVSVELLGSPIRALDFAGSPRPFIGGMFNLEDETSFANVGLSWRANFTDRFFTDYAFGLSVHDGTTIIPQADVNLDFATNTARIERKNNEIEFGSNLLFRNSLSIGAYLNENTTVEVVIEHLSNGKIFADVNEGTDNVGLRLGRKF